ncbi:MAG: heavy-metal-associated domain-containing protein [Chloroflexota bacterium]
MTQTVLNVPDISCEHCEHTIATTLEPVAGVQQVSVDITSKQVRVSYDDSVIGLDRIKELLREEDYPVASVQG